MPQQEVRQKLQQPMSAKNMQKYTNSATREHQKLLLAQTTSTLKTKSTAYKIKSPDKIIRPLPPFYTK